MKNIDDSIIDSLEVFVKTKILALIAKDEAAANLDTSMFFGKFHDEKSFEISLGERVQLKEVAQFTSRIFETDGPLYFADKKNAKLSNFHKTIECGKLGRLFTYDDNVPKNEFNESELKVTLFKHVSDIFKSAKIDENFSEDMVKIEFKNMTPYGTTQCVVCNSEKKVNALVVNAKIEKKNLTWISSNLLKHLRTVHKIQIQKKKNAVLRVIKIAEARMETKTQLITMPVICNLTQKFWMKFITIPVTWN